MSVIVCFETGIKSLTSFYNMIFFLKLEANKQHLQCHGYKNITYIVDLWRNKCTPISLKVATQM